MTENVKTETAVEEPIAQPEAGARTLRDIIASQLQTLQKHRASVLESGSVDSIHKMRVTTRRLQASLDLLQTRADPLKARKLKRNLREWRQRLSEVRNYDVFLELLEKETGSRRSKQQFESLIARLQERRESRAAKIRKYLERRSTGKIASKLGLSVEPAGEVADAIASPEDIEAEPDTSVSDAALDETQGHESPGANTETGEESSSVKTKTDALDDEAAIITRAAERLEQRLAEFQALAAQSHATTDPAEFHQLRIAAKRLRYLLEIVSELGHGDASRALVPLRTLQDRIGDWHDLEALEEEIITIVYRRKFIKEHLAESARMLQAAAHLNKKKQTLIARLFPVNVPRSITITSQRMARALRRRAAQLQASQRRRDE